MKRRIWLGGLLLAGLAAPLFAADRAAILKAQDLTAAPLAEEVISTNEKDGVVTTELYFSGGEFNGQPSRIYGYYSRPIAAGQYPGVVQLHGAGLQKLSPEASIFYAQNGFACLSIDWCGPAAQRKNPRQVPYSTFNSPGNMAYGDPEKKGRFKSYGPEVDGITNGVHFVLRSFMYLRQRPEVKSDALFLSGMSAGAHLSLIILGLDPGIRGAAVKYGCAFIRDLPGYYGGYFGPLTLCPPEEQDAWLAVLDPKVGIPAYRASVLLLSGTDDIFFWMPIVLKTYREIPTPKRLLMLPNDNHSQVGNEKLPLRYFRALLGAVPEFPTAETPMAEIKGAELQLTCRVTVPSPLTKASFYVKRMPAKEFTHGLRKDSPVKWEAVAAKTEGERCTAALPAPVADEQVVAYLLLEDQTGASVSSDTVEVPAFPKWRGLKP